MRVFRAMVEFVSVTPARVADLNRALVICFNDLSVASVPKCGREIRERLAASTGRRLSLLISWFQTPVLFGHQNQYRKNPTYYRALTGKP